jgi:glutathione S-transferase
MYTLFIANKNYSSWSLRLWVLMHELEIPFVEEIVLFDGMNNFENFRKFAPNAKVPCLYDDQEVVWDSLAICEYLAEDHVNVWPREKTVRAWARSAAAEMHSGFPALRNSCGMNVGLRVELNEISQALQADIDRLNELWCEGLSKFGGPFLTGAQFTAVDAFYAPVAFRVQTFGLALDPPAQAYCDNLLSLDSMQQWYAEGLLETMRETASEIEISSNGKVTADYRQL